MKNLSKHILGVASILSCCASFSSYGQVVGGVNAFEFLRTSTSPHLSALGGYAPAITDKDVSLFANNPALLRPTLHNNLGASYNIYYSDIGMMNAQYAYHADSIKTTFGAYIQNVNYGEMQQMDIYGNANGNIRANDMVIGVSASRSYLEKWRYGATLKYAHSTLADKKGAALLADVGVVFHDTSSLVTVGVVAKNMGFVIQKYNEDNSAEPLPFDMQIGITKELKNVPLKLFAVAHHLNKWDIRYNDPTDKSDKNLFEEEDNTKENSKYFGDKLFRHLNIGAELFLGKRVMLTGSYSFLRRKDLSTTNLKGGAGLSFGVGLYLNKFQIQYAQSHLATAGAYNEIGLNFHLSQFFKSKSNSSFGKLYEGW